MKNYLKSFIFRSFIFRIPILSLALVFLQPAEAAARKVAIIKADDVRKVSEAWDRFFALSKERSVKVSAGIICESLVGGNPDFVAWLKKHQATGDVEFWNHGWDHKRWKVAGGKELQEFCGSGYAHQKKHFAQSQTWMKKVLGKESVAFGAPYNAIDRDTATVLTEDPATRLVFGYANQQVGNKLLATMVLRGEGGGTGKPDFQKFKADYAKQKNLTFSAIQFHPAGFRDEHFEEYAKILDFMIEEGWTFVLPSEYIALQKTASLK